MTSTDSPTEYVNKNEEQLVEIIKHSTNSFPRALALAALVEYGDDPTVDAVVSEIKQLRDIQNE